MAASPASTIISWAARVVPSCFGAYFLTPPVYLVFPFNKSFNALKRSTSFFEDRFSLAMKNFRLIKNGLNLDAIRAELTESTLWVDMDSRGNRPKTQVNTDRIQLRANRQIPGRHYHNIHETVDLPAWNILTHSREFVLGFLREVGGDLGHVRVTSLNPYAEIPEHIDVGEYCAIRNRYHLVISSAHGTLFTSGDETVTMHENELWWFDNKKLHSVRNLGSSPRTHLVFDICPPATRV
jgi:hypothetical protein